MPGPSPRPVGREIWLVNHYADAPDRPNGTRHFDLARQLVARGHRVTIFAAGFSHVTRTEERLRSRRLYRSQSFDGVRFVWLRTMPYQGNTWRRQLNMLSFLVVFLMVQTRFARPDAIVGSTVHPLAAFGAWLAARARGARFVFEIRDLWPQTLVDLGAMRVGSPGERLLRAIEALLVRHAYAVVALLPGIPDYLRGRGLPADHVVYLPNGVDLIAFDRLARTGSEDPLSPAAASLAAIDRRRSEGRLVIGYVGSFGRVNALDVIVDAAAIAESRAPGRIAVVLVGDGPERTEVERRSHGIASVTIRPPVPKWAVPAILERLDATVVHATATPVYRYGISFNKLFESMAAGRPVVFACGTDHDPVAASGAGLSLPPDDPAALAGAFLELADLGPAERARMGAAGRRHVERRHGMDRLGATLERILTSETMPFDDAEAANGA